MKVTELAAIAKGLGPVIRDYVEKAVADVDLRLKTVETRTPERGEKGEPGDKGADGRPGDRGEPGAPGQDADPAVVLALKAEIAELRSELLLTKSLDLRPSIAEAVAEAIAAIPVPKDGKDGTPVDPLQVKAWIAEDVKAAVGTDVLPQIETLVGAAIAAIPVPKDGTDGASADPLQVKAWVDAEVHAAMESLPRPKDGQSVTVDDVAPLLQDFVTKAMREIPKPQNGKDGKDATSIASASISQSGELLLTMTDGTTKVVGIVVGQKGENGLPGVPGRDGQRGDDGADGLGFDDITQEYDGERTVVFKFHRGDRVKAMEPLLLPLDIYRGVYVEGKTYDRGDGVTWAGSEWHCNETTRSKPGDGSKAWTLKVKRGRDGKDGRDLSPVPMPVVKR